MKLLNKRLKHDFLGSMEKYWFVPRHLILKRETLCLKRKLEKNWVCPQIKYLESTLAPLFLEKDSTLSLRQQKNCLIYYFISSEESNQSLVKKSYQQM